MLLLCSPLLPANKFAPDQSEMVIKFASLKPFASTFLLVAVVVQGIKKGANTEKAASHHGIFL